MPPTCSGTPEPTHRTTTVPANAAVLRLVADVPLPGSPSRFDYQSLDPITGRLWIAHMGAGQLVVVDTARRKVLGRLLIGRP